MPLQAREATPPVRSPLAAPDAARLFKALSPRPLPRGEVGCDDPKLLRDELRALVDALAPRLPGLEAFELMSDACVTGPRPAPDLS